MNPSILLKCHNCWTWIMFIKRWGDFQPELDSSGFSARNWWDLLAKKPVTNGCVCQVTWFAVWQPQVQLAKTSARCPHRNGVSIKGGAPNGWFITEHPPKSG